MEWTLTRDAIIALRTTAPKLDLRTRLYVGLLGCARPRRGQRGGRTKQPDSHQRAIPVITSYRQKVKPPVFRRSRVLAAVRKTPNAVSNEAHTAQANPHTIPSLYLLNAAAITKPHAVEQLAVDVTNHGCDIAVITETHCKTKHTDSVLHIPGYTLHRRDRLRRRGGGVAVYVRDTIQSIVWTAAKDDRAFELHWQKLGEVFLGAVYHPPRPLYTSESILKYIEEALDEICSNFPSATIIMAGDFNQLSDQDVAERTGLIQIVHQPTRGRNILDRIFVSRPIYRSVRVISSVMRSDHSAVVAYAERPKFTYKTSINKVFRPVSPAQHALFLQHLSDKGFCDSATQSTLLLLKIPKPILMLFTKQLSNFLIDFIQSV